jgi:holo-[acyl-carrier protein] synthase
MILGIGLDIIEIRRIKQAIERERFVQRVFTPREQEYCHSRGQQGPGSYAARFAGKEAVLKAFATGLTRGKWEEIEIINNEHGQPQVKLSGYYQELAEDRGVASIHISLTHAREYAAAQVILWGGVSD